MARKRTKKVMGRPSKKVVPPRIAAPPELVANVVLNAGRPKGPVHKIVGITVWGLQTASGLARNSV